jgi:6-phosphogluconolactonase (cycloisomerase 2 family)
MMRFHLGLPSYAVTVLVTLVAGSAAAQQLPDPNAAAAAVTCQQAITRVGALFIGRKLRNLDTCTNGIQRCVQIKPGDDKCMTTAGARCTKLLARTFGDDDAGLIALVRRKCAPTLVSFADLMSENGIGFEDLVERCDDEFGLTVDDLPSLATCIAREHQRQPDLVFGAESPRARELITATGATLPAGSELPDFAGDGAGVGDPKGAGKAIQQCAAATSKAAAHFLVRKVQGLERCAARIFTCVQTTTKAATVGKVETVAANDCMPVSRAACDQEFARIAGDEAAMRKAIERRCAESALPFATLRSAHAANIDALASECQNYGVATLDSLADYETCVARIHACRAEALLLFQLPRAQELVAYAARQLRSSFCPDTNGGGFTLVDSKFHVNGGAPGLDGGRAVAVSNDGEHVYVASFNDDSLSVFTRDPDTGSLTALEVHVDAVDGADGLNGARAVALSPDGAHVYVASSRDDAVAVFARNAGTGALTYVQRKRNGAGVLDSMNGARAVAVSPDGNHVYVAADPSNAVAVFSRDAGTGMLTFIEAQKNLTGGVDGLLGPYALAISPDGAHLYVASFDDDAVAVFARDETTGVLTFVEREKNGIGGVDGLDGARALAISPDGAHLYVAGSLGRALVTFARDATTGALTQIGIRRHVFAAIDGLTRPTAVAMSADGAHVYVGSAFDNVVAGYSRDPISGALSLRASAQLSVGADKSKPGVVALTVSPEGRHLYVTESKHDLLAALAILP